MNLRFFWVILVNLLGSNAAIYLLVNYGHRNPMHLWYIMGAFSLFLLLILIFVLSKFRSKVNKLRVLQWAILVGVFAPFLTFYFQKGLNSAEPLSYLTDTFRLRFLNYFLFQYLAPPLFMLNLVLLRWLNRDEYATEPL